MPAGYVLYAPPAYVPRAVAFPTSPVSADAVLLMTARLRPRVRAAAGWAGCSCRAWPATSSAAGSARSRRSAAPAPRRRPGGEAPDYSCLLPADYLLAVGFKTVRPHPRTPRLRLDVKTTVTWKEDVEYALERLLSSMQAPVLSR